MNVLKPHLQTTLLTLLASNTSQHEIARVTKIDRKTIRAYAKRWREQQANSPGVATGSADQIAPPRPPAAIHPTRKCLSPQQTQITRSNWTPAPNAKRVTRLTITLVIILN